uniref:Sideroflexin 4 n=1 Tax=Cyprinodon variegatus TaxID=28743 RepID=A0A3Q2DR38_CYPVA
MDPNLQLWKSHGQSFLSRLKTWFNLLDPSLLLSSDAEILKAHALLGSREQVVASLLFHSGVKPALFWQFLLQGYNAGFNYMNRNTSAEQGKKASLKHLLLIAGTVSYTTFAGALPQIIVNRLRVRSPPLQTFCRSILPIPLSALAFFNVLTIRNEETETGIQVFDRNGNAVGVSRAAGEKAVWETAQSRAVLFGTTAAVPNLLSLLLQTRFFQRNSLLVAPCRHISVVLTLCLMVPVSFSLFSPVGTIKREKVEKELLPGAVGEELIYHRGL